MYPNMYCQFGCGILRMVGPKKQKFWQKINILKGNLYLENMGGTSLSKIGHDFRKSVHRKLKLGRYIF